VCTFGDDDEEMPQPSTNLVAPMQKEQSPCKDIRCLSLKELFTNMYETGSRGSGSKEREEAMSDFSK
jgi:hypothetical protein